MKKVKVFNDLEAAFNAIKEGTARKVVYKDLGIALVRKNNELFAIQDQCPHAKASLSVGIINAFNEIVCPLHSYCYDLKTGREKDQKSADAKVWKVIVEENGIFIELDI